MKTTPCIHSPVGLCSCGIKPLPDAAIKELGYRIYSLIHHDTREGLMDKIVCEIADALATAIHNSKRKR